MDKSMGEWTSEQKAEYIKANLDKHRAFTLDEALLGEILAFLDDSL